MTMPLSTRVSCCRVLLTHLERKLAAAVVRQPWIRAFSAACSSKPRSAAWRKRQCDKAAAVSALQTLQQPQQMLPNSGHGSVWCGHCPSSPRFCLVPRLLMPTAHRELKLERSYLTRSCTRGTATGRCSNVGNVACDRECVRPSENRLLAQHADFVTAVGEKTHSPSTRRR
jgi:hypothetical protein